MNLLLLLLSSCSGKPGSFETDSEDTQTVEDSAVAAEDCEEDDHRFPLEELESDCDRNGVEDAEDLENPATIFCVLEHLGTSWVGSELIFGISGFETARAAPHNHFLGAFSRICMGFVWDFPKILYKLKITGIFNIPCISRIF